MSGSNGGYNLWWESYKVEYIREKRRKCNLNGLYQKFGAYIYLICNIWMVCEQTIGVFISTTSHGSTWPSLCISTLSVLTFDADYEWAFCVNARKCSAFDSTKHKIFQEKVKKKITRTPYSVLKQYESTASISLFKFA